MSGDGGEAEEMNAENEQDYINSMGYSSSQEVFSIFFILEKESRCLFEFDSVKFKG